MQEVAGSHILAAEEPKKVWKKISLHESCRMGRRIVMMKLIGSLGHCECDGHTVHKLSQRRLAADWLVPRESDCSRMHSKVSSDWLQVTPRPHDRFSWYLKWLDTFRRILVQGEWRDRCLRQTDTQTPKRSILLHPPPEWRCETT